MDTTQASVRIKEEALRLGFSACGICEAGPVGIHADYLQKWLDEGCNAGMAYMNNYFNLRSDSSLMIKNGRSVIVTALNYYPAKRQKNEAAQIAYFAYGTDYHFIVKDRLNKLVDFIRKDIAPCQAKVCCDSAPVLEKYHAEKAGLGWIGKNTQLIIPNKGSFFSLGVIILDIPLAYDAPLESRCGTCTKCMDACPTDAIVTPCRLDCNRCLSYWTIEDRGEFPDFYQDKVGNIVFGCDICNKICPHNQKAAGTMIAEYSPSEALLNLKKEDIQCMDESTFKSLFSKSPIKRIGLNGLKKNTGNQSC